MANTALKLTNAHLCAIFGVTLVCLHNWRKGTPTKHPLPILKQTDRRVFYSVKDVKKWAHDNDVPMLIQPEVLLAQQGLTTPNRLPAEARAR